MKIILAALLSISIFGLAVSGQTPAPTVSPTPVADESMVTETPSKAVKVVEERINETEFFARYTLESLTNDRGNWHEARFGFIHRFTKRQVLYGHYRETEMFRLRDREVFVGLYQPLDEKHTLNVEASVSPTNRVVANWSASATVERTLGNGWIGKAGYRRTDRDIAKVNTLHTGIEKYWGKNRAAYIFSLNNLENTGTSPSHRAQYARYYGEKSSFTVNLTAGDEIEQTGPSTVLKSRIYNVSFDGQHRFANKWYANYGFGFHRQGNLYDRRRVSVGLRFEF